MPLLRTRPHPANPHLQAWLRVDGSLTERLRQHGTVQVVVLRQGALRLWPQEQRDLDHPNGHVREVALLVDGRPAVWARSATTHDALHGPWKSLTRLGSRPLAELLFQGRSVARSPLRPSRLAGHGPIAQHLRQDWPGLPVAGPLPLWARSSVFRHQGQPLRVMEAFAPWLAGLSPGD